MKSNVEQEDTVKYLIKAKGHASIKLNYFQNIYTDLDERNTNILYGKCN